MDFTLFAFVLTLVSLTQGAYIPAPTATPAYAYPSSVPAVASQSQSVIRSLDGNSVYSTYSKAVDTPHSSVRKYDSRINNDAVVYAHVPTVSYAAPVYHKPTYVSSPVYHYTAPNYYPHSSYPSYSAPVYSAPARVYHPTVYHAPSYYPAVKSVPAVHAPAAHYSDAAAHYSDAAAVSHLTFEGLGAHYAW